MARVPDRLRRGHGGGVWGYGLGYDKNTTTQNGFGGVGKKFWFVLISFVFSKNPKPPQKPKNNIGGVRLFHSGTRGGAVCCVV